MTIPDTLLLYSENDVLDEVLTAEVAASTSTLVEKNANASADNFDDIFNAFVPPDEDPFASFFSSGGPTVDDGEDTDEQSHYQCGCTQAQCTNTV